MSYILGLDVGQAQDFTALSALERDVRPSGRADRDLGECWDDHYTIVHLARPPLKTAYPELVRITRETVDHPKLVEAGRDLVVDATGVGRPVVDMLREKGLEPRPVTITAGQQQTMGDDGFWHVPKRVLVSMLAIVLQTERLHVVRTLPLASVLTREMLNFKVKISTHANDSYEAWRDGEHDDLVLSVALAVWWGERNPLGGWRRTAGDDAKERRRRAAIEKAETPWWRRRDGADRGEGAWWRK